MDLETVKKYLEKEYGGEDENNVPTIHGMPSRFFENFIKQGLRVDLIEQGRLLCSMKVPPRLLVGTLNFNSLENSISLFAFEN